MHNVILYPFYFFYYTSTLVEANEIYYPSIRTHIHLFPKTTPWASIVSVPRASRTPSMAQPGHASTPTCPAPSTNTTANQTKREQPPTCAVLYYSHGSGSPTPWNGAPVARVPAGARLVNCVDESLGSGGGAEGICKYE